MFVVTVKFGHRDETVEGSVGYRCEYVHKTFGEDATLSEIRDWIKKDFLFGGEILSVYITPEGERWEDAIKSWTDEVWADLTKGKS